MMSKKIEKAPSPNLVGSPNIDFQSSKTNRMYVISYSGKVWTQKVWQIHCYEH